MVSSCFSNTFSTKKLKKCGLIHSRERVKISPRLRIFYDSKVMPGRGYVRFFPPQKVNSWKMVVERSTDWGQKESHWLLMVGFWWSRRLSQASWYTYIYIYIHTEQPLISERSLVTCLKLYQLIDFSLLHIFRDFLTKTYPVPASHPSRNASVPHMVLRTSPYKLQRSPAAKKSCLFVCRPSRIEAFFLVLRQIRSIKNTGFQKTGIPYRTRIIAGRVDSIT